MPCNDDTPCGWMVGISEWRSSDRPHQRGREEGGTGELWETQPSLFPRIREMSTPYAGCSLKGASRPAIESGISSSTSMGGGL